MTTFVAQLNSTPWKLTETEFPAKSARSAGAMPRVHLSFNNNHANYGAVNARELVAMLVDHGAMVFRS